MGERMGRSGRRTDLGDESWVYTCFCNVEGGAGMKGVARREDEREYRCVVIRAL